MRNACPCKGAQSWTMEMFAPAREPSLGQLESFAPASEPSHGQLENIHVYHQNHHKSGLRTNRPHQSGASFHDNSDFATPEA